MEERISNCLNILTVIANQPKLVLQDLHYKIKQILKQFPPALNKNRFIYGGLIQLAVIEFLNKISDAVDYDAGHTVGAHYKHDTMFMKTDISIKGCSDTKSSITLINKNTQTEHSVKDINLFTVYTREGKILLFPVEMLDSKFIKDTGAKIEIRGSAYTRVLRGGQHVLDLPELSEEQKTVVLNMNVVDHEQELFKKYIL